MRHYGIENNGTITTDDIIVSGRLNVPCEATSPVGDYEEGDIYYNTTDSLLYKYVAGTGWTILDRILKTSNDASTTTLYPVMATGVGSDELARINTTSGYFSFNSSTGVLTTIEQKSKKNTITGSVADDSTVELLKLAGSTVPGAGNLSVVASRDDGTVANIYTSLQSSDVGGTNRYLLLQPSGSSVIIGASALLASEKLHVNGQIAATSIKITDAPTLGYVLKCDAAGTGTWQEEGTDILTRSADPNISTDVTIRGPQATMTAGENLAFGNLCYRKSDGKWWKANAGAVATMRVAAIAGATILADATGLFALPGSFLRKFSWSFTVGGDIYADTTSGAMTQTILSGSGNQLQTVGYAYSADIIYFDGCPVIIELV